MPNVENTLSSLPMFAELSKRDLRELSSLMTGVRIPAGRDITTEGAPSREAVLITDGTAEVKVGNEVVATVGPGDFVGELGLIAGTPRTATVTAATDISAEILSRSEFDSLLDKEPSVARKVLVGAVRRLVELEEARC